MELRLGSWDHAQFENLAHDLVRAKEHGGPSDIQRLQRELEGARPWLVRLSNVPGTNEQARQYIEQNPTQKPDGSSETLAGAALSNVGDIARVLDISQQLAATLYLQASDQRPNYPGLPETVIAIYEYLAWLNRMLDFLHDLFACTIAVDADSADAIPEHETVTGYVQDLLNDDSAGGPLVMQILNRIDDAGEKIRKLRGGMGPQLPHDLFEYMVGTYRAQQDKMARLLGTIASRGYLHKKQALAVLRWLKTQPEVNGVTSMVAMAFFSAAAAQMMLVEGDPRESDSWARDEKVMKIFTKTIHQEEWSNSDLCACTKLVWFFFYQSYFHIVPSIGFELAQLDQFLSDAVYANAFGFLLDTITVIRIDRGTQRDERGRSGIDLAATRSNGQNDQYILATIQSIVDFIATLPRFCRALRNKEEDNAKRGGQARYQQFLMLVAATYRELPDDSASDLWDQTSFTDVVLDNKGPHLSPATCDMFAALAKGKACAEKCFKALRGKTDWPASYSKLAQNILQSTSVIYDPRTNTNNPQQQPDGQSQPNYEALQGWLQIMVTITQYSPDARTALSQLKPSSLHSLFDLINHEIPTSLKVEALRILTTYAVDEEEQFHLVKHYHRVTPPLDVRPPSGQPTPSSWIDRQVAEEINQGRFPLLAAHFRFFTAVLAIPASKEGVPALHERALRMVMEGTGMITNGVLAMDAIDRDELCDVIVTFIETAIQNVVPTLDPSVLRHAPSLSSAALVISETPGFKVMVRLLSHNNLMEGLCSYLDRLCIDHKYNDTLLKVLRILYRLVELQDVLFGVVISTLERSGQYSSPHSLQKVDSFLISHHEIVIRIALLVDAASGNDAIGLVAVKFIQALSNTHLFGAGDRFGSEYSISVNRLAGLLESSSDSIRIAQGFQRRLEAASGAMTDDDVAEAVAAVLNGQEVQELHTVIRSSIIDLLLAGTQNVSEPNVAHFLLGFDFHAAHLGLQKGDADSARVACLDLILTQLDSFITDEHPVLAAKEAELVYQLFADPTYGKEVLLYAAQREYTREQLTHLPEGPAGAKFGHQGVQGFNLQKYQAETSAEAVFAFIRFNQFILSSVALDVFTFYGDGPGQEEMAQLLFNDWFDASQQDRKPILVELLNIIDMTWLEEEPKTLALQVFINFDFDRFKSEIDWWNTDDMATALRAAIPAQAQEQGRQEIDYITAVFAHQNRKTDLRLAQGAFIATWASTLKVTLQMMSKHIEEDRREMVLFELLDAIANKFEVDLPLGVVEVLSESVLVIVNMLVPLLQSYVGVNMPIDQCTAVLGYMLAIVTMPGTSESARGNVYAAINLYLTLLTGQSAQYPDGASDGTGMTGHTYQTAMTAASTLTVPSLQRETLAVIDSRKDRFFATLCRDAMEDRDVWKTECYSLLGALVSVCRNDRDRAILQPLVKAGYLAIIVRSIKEQEMPLIQCLEPHPPALHAYWVFEQKMAFLLAVASTRKGAEQLVNAGIFQTLSTCAFVNAQIITREVLQNEEHYDMVKRQHDTVLGVLQLAVRILGSLGVGKGVAEQAISFLNAHKEALLLLLRENQNSVTVTSIQETRIIIALLGMVAPKLASDDLASPSGMGGFHLAVLSTAARFFSNDWVQVLVDREEEGDAAAEVIELNHAILSYLSTTTTGLKSGHGQPVLVTGAQRSAVGTTRYITSAPSLQDVVEMVQMCGERVQLVEQDYEKVHMRVQAGNLDLLAEEVAELKADVLEEVEQESHDALDCLAQHSQMLYNMIDSLLLLLWRHLLFYANEAGDNNVQPRNLSSSLAYSTQMGSTRGASRDTLQRVAMSLSGVMEAINIDREVPPELRSEGAQGAEYRRILVRRLREMMTALTDV